MEKPILIDVSKRPRIYRSSDIEFKNMLAIDFACVNISGNVQTIVPFINLEHVKLFLINKFGIEQFKAWFPGGLKHLPRNE